jgi:hypothetical protein
VNPDNLPPMQGATDVGEWNALDRISVVGMSYRSEALDQLNKRGLIGTDPETMYLSANLVQEPDNPYDPEAIAVYIGQIHVGYIPRGQTDRLKEYFVNNREMLLVTAKLTTAFDGMWRAEMEIAIDEIYIWSKTLRKPVRINS